MNCTFERNFTVQPIKATQKSRIIKPCRVQGSAAPAVAGPKSLQGNNFEYILIKNFRRYNSAVLPR